MMDAKTVKTKYLEKYSPCERYALSALGGDLDTVIAKYIETGSDLAGENIFASFLANVDDAEEIHNLVIEETESRYFASVSRETAVAICNMLGDFGKISIHDAVPELSYNGFRFMTAWNRANPEQDEIQAPAGIEI